MESIESKLKEIKTSFLFNFLNESYIDDSYLFLSSLPDEYLAKITKDKIFLTIFELYDHKNKLTNHDFYNKLQSTSTIKLKNKQNNLSESKKEETIQKENKYISMIENFIKEKEEANIKNKELESICTSAMTKYYHEELFDFLQILYSDTLITQRILNSKSQNFKNLINFEQKVIEFFNKEVNDKDGYTYVKDSAFNFATRITGKTVTLRFEKEVKVDLMNLLAIMYEVNYYKKWYPFCHISETINQPGKAKKCVYMVVEIPIIKNRDFLIYGFGINRIRENGTILILCRGIQKNSGIFYREFKQMENKNYVRGDILIFGFEIKIIDLKRVILRGLCNVDPKISFIPQAIINAVSEKFAGDMFKKFLNVANNYEGSIYQNRNPSKIDMEFYNFIRDEVKLHFEKKENESSVINHFNSNIDLVDKNKK